MREVLHARPTTDASDYDGIGRRIVAQFPVTLAYLAQAERLESLRGKAVYLATPYTDYPDGRPSAAHAATCVAAALTRMGLSVYSPIVHGHAICEVSDVDPVDPDMWQAIDAPWVEAAEACVVATLPGWDTSRGVAHEIASFLTAGKPVVYVDPQSL